MSKRRVKRKAHHLYLTIIVASVPGGSSCEIQNTIILQTLKDKFHERKFGVGIRFALTCRACPFADVELPVSYFLVPSLVQQRTPCSDCR